MFAGFGAAEDTNARFRQLLDAGQTGLSIAYDMPTLYGYDTDDPEAEGEFGTCGVAVSSLADMEVLLAGPAARSGLDLDDDQLAGRADLGDVHRGRREGRGPARPASRARPRTTSSRSSSPRRSTCSRRRRRCASSPTPSSSGPRELPRWNTVSISGYHIREAGSTAVQELAFTIADGMAYVEDALARGLRIDDFAPRLSFFFNSHSDFFEEIAKFRASRRIWHRLMTERYGAENERSAWMRFHTQTAGVSLTPQQPLNNLTRVAIQALAAVLGGTQSLHTDAHDEALAVPTAEAALLALRQQQIIAEETGVDATVDPLGGSWFVEALTAEVERQAWRYIDEIDRRGGMVAAVTEGYPQREIADAAYRYQREFDAGERRVVGVNAYVDETEVTAVPVLQVPAGSLEAPARPPRADAPGPRRRGRRRGARRACARRPRGRGTATPTSCRTSCGAPPPTPRSVSSARSCARSSGSTASRSRSRRRRARPALRASRAGHPRRSAAAPVAGSGGRGAHPGRRPSPRTRGTARPHRGRAPPTR